MKSTKVLTRTNPPNPARPLPCNSGDEARIAWPNDETSMVRESVAHQIQPRSDWISHPPFDTPERSSNKPHDGPQMAANTGTTLLQS